MYRDKIDKEQDLHESNIEQLVSYLVNTGYNKRAEALKELILSEMFGVEPNIFNSVDCNNNVCFFLEKSNIFSYSINKSCECGVREQKSSFIYLDAKENEDIGKMFNFIERDVTPIQKITCSNGHNYKINLEFGECLYFTITRFNDNNLLNIITNPYVPETIIVKNCTYILKCFVNYRGSRLKSGIGHYQAFCRTPLGGWEVYDNSQPNVLTMVEFVTPHLFIYAKETLYK